MTQKARLHRLSTHTGFGRTLAAFVFFSVLAAVGCDAVPTRDAQRAYVEQGFGRRFSGDVTKEYYIGIGDRVGIQSLQYPELVMLQEIRPDGRITVPLVGDIKVAGLTTREVKDKLATLLKERGFKNVESDLLVTVPLRASKRIFVVGQANKIGRLIFTGDMTILDVMSQVGANPQADTDDIRILRGDPLHPEIIHVDLDEISREGLTRTNVQMQPDDIVYIPPTNVARVGLFINDALFPFKIVLGAVGTIISTALVPARFEAIDQISQRISEGNMQRGGRGGGVVY